MSDDDRGVLRELAEVVRELVGATARLEGAVRASLDRGEARAVALAEFRAELRPVVTWIEAQQEAAAKLAADRALVDEKRALADQQRQAAYATWFAGFLEAFTVKRMAAVAAILVPTCSGGGVAVGALGSERIHEALHVLLGEDHDDEPAGAVVQPTQPAPAPDPLLGGPDVR